MNDGIIVIDLSIVTCSLWHKIVFLLLIANLLCIIVDVINSRSCNNF